MSSKLNKEKIGSFLDDFIMMADGKKVSDSIWREEPVDLITFFRSKDFLGENPYPGKQTELLEKVNQTIMFKLTGDEALCAEDLRQITEYVVLFGKGCKHGDTKIFDPVTGKMNTLYELSKDSQPFNVRSMDAETQTLTNSNTTGVVEVGEGELFEIVTNSGRRTKVFSEHMFFSRNYTGSDTKGRYRGTEWKRVKDMSVGDYIAVSTAPVTFNGTTIPNNELKLVGYMLGDGNISDQWKCSFYASIKEVEEDYCYILRSFGIEPKYPKYGNEDRPDRNCVMIDSSLTPWESRKMGGNPVTNVLRKYGLQGKNAYSKCIPKEFFDLNKECIVTFLSALFATDGWVCMLNNKIPQIGYCSVNRGMVEDIQLLLSKIGIYSRIDSKKTGSKLGIAYQLTINSEIDFLKFCDTINIVGKHDKQDSICNFIRTTRDTNRSSRGKVLDTDIRFERIKEINSIGDHKYYDLTVDTYANYVSDGFIDHNSGKDFLISGIMAYMCYILCCMKDPHDYFKFGHDEPIDLINVAMNAKQANDVFFVKLKARLKSCKWFRKVNYNPAGVENPGANEYQVTKNQIRFYKNISAHSAHSDADSFEGFNPLMVIFDEIGGFEVDKAKSCYNTLRSSAVTRYSNKMILMFISFPRASDDFMMTKYNEAEEGKDPEVYAIRGATWEVNISKKRSDFDKEYKDDPEGAKMRLETIPPAYRDGFFQFPEKVDGVVMMGKQSQCPNLIVQEKITTRRLHNGEERHFIGLEIYNLTLNPSYTYYLGGDGGVNTDSYCLSLFHAEPMLVQCLENDMLVNKYVNKPVEDLILEWRPSKKDRLPVDLINVADVLERICRQVFVKKALFDKFNSAEVVQRLMVCGVEAEDKNWSNPFQMQVYTNAKSLIYTSQVSLLDYKSRYTDKLSPNEELKAIKIINGTKIDHDRDKSKDFSDARVGAIYLCSTDTVEMATNFSMPTIKSARRK